MSFLDELQEKFGTQDLYEVLDVKDKKSTNGIIKSAYYKSSLRWHPDRVAEEDKQEATVKFQLLGKAYCILSNDERRSLYDETGDVGEDDYTLDNVKGNDWTAYWRAMFKQVTIKDIKTFKRKYQGSEEEAEDLKAAYIEQRGDMEKIMEQVLCAEIDDESRLRAILQEAIDNNEIEAFDAFVTANSKGGRKRRKKAEKEAREAEKVAQEMGIDLDGKDSLKSLIMARRPQSQGNLDTLISSLEAKYSKGAKGKSKPARKRKEGKK